MAKVEAGNIKGAIGNIIFYTMNGNSYAKLKPVPKSKKRKKEEQSPQVSVFSTVSQFGTPIINKLKPYLGFAFKLNTYNHFRSWLSTEWKAHANDSVWPLSVADTPIHNLNEATDLRDVLLLMPEVSVAKNRSVSVSFPSFVPTHKMLLII